MKFVAIVLSCLLATVYGLDQQFVEKLMEKLTEVGQECQKKTSATDDDIAALTSHKVPDSHEGKCMIACFHEHFGAQDSDGNLNKDGILTALEPLKTEDADLYGKVKIISDTCVEAAEKDADKCITAANFATCGIKKAKELGLDSSLFTV